MRVRWFEVKQREIRLIAAGSQTQKNTNKKNARYLSSDGVGLAPLKVVQEVDPGPPDGL